MSTTVSHELLDAARSGVIAYELLRRAATATSLSAPEALDQLSCYVARQYASGSMSFEAADTIMNAAFSVASSEPFWAEHDRTIPQITFQIYLAFDGGEYLRLGDAAGTDPEVKYTKVLLEQFLAAQENGA